MSFTLFRSHRIAVGVGFVCLLACCGAYADIPAVCVTSNSELKSALVLAETSAVTIQLVQGSYDLGNTVWNESTIPGYVAGFQAGSSLLGGYIDSTCATRNVDVNNTILVDTATTSGDVLATLGDATLEGLTFKLPYGLFVEAVSDPTNSLAANTQLIFRRDVFAQTTQKDTTPLSVYWDADASLGGVIRVVDSLFHDNQVACDNGDCAALGVLVRNGKPKTELVNNTIVDNAGQLGGVYISSLASTPVYAYNNIFYGNASKDFVVETGNDITLVDNVIGTHSYATPATAPVGTTTADPKLDANFHPIESPASNVINSGSSSVIGGLPSTDLPGRARQIGSAPDRGAFESSINDQPILSVTTTADSGVGSLRSAIASLNANTGGLILFNLGSSCPYVIHLQTPLPTITKPTAISGYTQAGSSVNDLEFGDDAVICVILDGSTNNISSALGVAANADDGTQLQVSGVAFGGFTNNAIGLYGGSAHTVTGIHIGGSVGGVALAPVGNGIVIGPGVHDAKIGDGASNADLSERNIIGGATGGGIIIDGANNTTGAAHDNQVSNNYVGVGWDNTNGVFTNRANGGAGITIGGYNNEVSNNEIEFNGGYGIDVTDVTAHDNTIETNFIGYLALSLTGTGNHGGILVENTAHDNAFNYNSIFHNSGTGIRILSGQRNNLFFNQILDNVGLGIDLATAGITPNDNDSSTQAADYANRGQNFPVLTGAIGGHSTGTFTGTLTSTPGDYIIQLNASPICDSSGNGEGEFPFANFRVTIGPASNNGQATISFSMPNPYPIGLASNPFVTAIATDSSGNSSEFSSCLLYTDDTIFADEFESSTN